MVVGRGNDAAWHRWRRRWTVACVPGAGLAVLLWGPADVLLASLFPVFLGAMVRGLALSEATGAHARTRRATTASCARAGASAAVIFVAVIALGTISVAAAIAVLVLLALTSPPAAGLRRPLFAPRRRAGQDTLTTMTTAELWHLWRESYVALGETRDLGERARLVALRHRLLDEIESRDAVAVQAWLESGGLASGEPDAA